MLAETGLSCSVGIGDNKLRAKIATGFAKPVTGIAEPPGIYRLTRENWAAVMAGRPTDALWGIGSRTSAKLAAMGLRTVADLARADPAVLAERLGPKMGPYYRLLAYSAGDTEVTDTPYVPKAHSRETTFQESTPTPRNWPIRCASWPGTSRRTS